jgi:uncharacterized protein YlaI
MKVKCILCDNIEDIDDDSFIAKRLKNRPIHTYMCDECHDRVKEKTLANHTAKKMKTNSTDA